MRDDVESNKTDKIYVVSEGLCFVSAVLLVAGRSKWKPEFNPKPVHLKFVLGEVAM
jgi:hypothetical protein